MNIAAKVMNLIKFLNVYLRNDGFNIFDEFLYRFKKKD